MIRLTASASVLAAALTLSACATDNDTVRGAAIGAGGGAVVGAVVPGVSPIEGAAIGAVGGAIIGALQDKDRNRGDRRYCRDRYGRDTDNYRGCMGRR